MKLIFLDIDGDMTSKNGYLKEGRKMGTDLDFHADHVEALNHILDNVPDARIVVTSTYRWMYSVTELKEQFMNNGIDWKYVISKTPDEVQMGTFRGYEVQHWLDNYPQIAKEKFGVDLVVDNYVILDDDADFLGKQFDNFVRTTKDHGLTYVEAEKAINVLNGVVNKKDVVIKRQLDAHGYYRDNKLKVVK